MKLTRNFIGLALLWSTLLCGQSQAVLSVSDPLDNTLFVGVEEDRYPLSYYEHYPARLTGFDVEYADNLCKKLKRRCQVVAASYSELIRMLADERVDVLVASLNDTPQHRDSLAFSEPYYVSHSVLMCSFPLPSMVDAYMLSPYVIGDKEGSKQQETLRQVLAYIKLKGVVSFSSYRAMFNALLRGKIDCMLADSHTGYDLIKTAAEQDSERIYFSANLQFVRNEFNQERIAVRKADAAYLRLINRAIQEMDADGTHQRLSLKYFPFTAY
ncbi:MAG: transporter substrate-binding domain-containing protein [Succinivibrio sp.]|nr:transporter substrate-binding domain-containing protein [Succinivibrio sp.]